MYCPNCGKVLGGQGGRFCPSCGKELKLAQAPKTAPKSAGFPYKPVLLGIGVVVVVLLLVLLLRPSESAGKPLSTEPAQETIPVSEPTAQLPEATPDPDPESTIVGHWVTNTGIGLTFTEDGTFYLTSGDLSLGEDYFHYKIKDEETLYLCPETTLFGAGFDMPFTLNGDSLYLEIRGVTFALTRDNTF